MLGPDERQRELSAIFDAMQRGKGCLLTGSAGVGKSAIASMAADAFESTHHVVRVRATTGSAELPLAAFAAQLGASERSLTPLVAEARAVINERAAGRPVLLSVDDIDLLDDTSTVLVHQLVSCGEAALLATYRYGRLLPSEIVDLRQRGDITQLIFAELDRPAIASMAARVTGRPLSAASLDRLASVTKGNALSIQVVLTGALESNGLVDTEHGADLVRLPFEAPAVVDMVRQRLGFLDDAQRTALTAVALAEPCGPAEVASVADHAMLEFLESAELITSTFDRARLVIHLAHPLFGEVLRSSTPPLQRRRALGVLANDLAATGARRRMDRTRLARLGLDGGVPVLREVTLGAIAMCHVSGDMFLAERLGRAEFDRSRDFRIGWDLAQSIMALGDTPEHDRVVDDLRSIASTTGERLAVAFQESQGVYWLRGNHQAAMAIIDAALEASPVDEPATAPVTRQDLLARRALMFATSGLPAPAWEGYHALGELPPGTALILALLTASIAALLDGQPQLAVDTLERGRAMFSRMGEAGAAAWIRRLISNRVLAHGVAGDLDRWESDTSRLLQHAIDEQQLALGYMLSAHVQALRGRPSLGLPLIEASLRWWQMSNGGGGLPRRYVLSTAVHLYGSAGDVTRCRAVLADFDADTHDSRLLDALADVGRARMLVADSRPEEARSFLRSAMLKHHERGDRPGEMNCAYEVVRLDRAEEVTARMTKLASTSTSALFDVQALHARGAATNDPDLLEEATEKFARLGFNLFAVGAAGEAADAARRAGNQRRAAAALTRVQELRALCDHDMPMAATQTAAAGPVALTRREREVGALAAQGLGNREISERLFISKRTTENHLARVYEKFGITSRAQLVRLLDGRGPGRPPAEQS